MATTKEQIAEWFDLGLVDQQLAVGALGINKGVYGYMLVVCDTYEYEDYPVYTTAVPEDFWAAYKKYNGKNMQKIMEVYVLDPTRRNNQLNGPGRSWSVPEDQYAGLVQDNYIMVEEEELRMLLDKQEKENKERELVDVITKEQANPTTHKVKVGKFLTIECLKTGKKSRQIAPADIKMAGLNIDCPSCGEVISIKKKSARGFLDGYQTYDANEDRGSASDWQSTFRQVVKPSDATGKDSFIDPTNDSTPAKPRRRIRFEDD